MLVTETREKVVKTADTAGAGKNSKKSEKKYLENLIQVSYIRYSIIIRKKFVPMLVLFDSGNKVNAIYLTFTWELRLTIVNTIYLTFAWELGLSIRLTDVKVQKINNTILDTFEIMVTAFAMTDKANRVRFFEKIFLVANVSPKVVFGMSFLIFNSADINFLG